MRLDHDQEADAVYILLRDEPYAYGEDLDAERRIDYGSDASPIGIELLSVSSGVRLDDLPRASEIANLLEQKKIKVFAR